jgi:hypothetical protein
MDSVRGLEDRLDPGAAILRLPKREPSTNGSPAAPTIFGLPRREPAAAPPRSVVYVIDRSASMKEGLPIAKEELLRDLAGLPDTTLFQVIFYNTHAAAMDLGIKRPLFPATLENYHRTQRFLARIDSAGGTDHLTALKKALDLKPEMICYITDADILKPEQVRELTEMNQQAQKAGGVPARIHCIELNTANKDKRDNPMRLLARENQGHYLGIDLHLFGLPRP